MTTREEGSPGGSRPPAVHPGAHPAVRPVVHPRDDRAAAAPNQPALYDCLVTHVRSRPLRHTVRHRTYMWLVDVDALPRLPYPLRPLARFEPRDHFGGGAPTIRAGLERFLAARGMDPPAHVLMLTNARVLGHVFNPLTLYWCHDGDGERTCVVAEVHNTYGERHCYLMNTDAAGEAVTGKEFYVSPFFPVDGAYRMSLPRPGTRLRLTVRLERDGGRPFTATLRGRRLPATTAALLRLAIRYPWPTAAVTAAIRLHGIRLYLRGLPVRPRPRHRTQEGLE